MLDPRGAQVCNYQCIVSHESPKLEDFTLCILQVRPAPSACAT